MKLTVEMIQLSFEVRLFKIKTTPSEENRFDHNETVPATVLLSINDIREK